MLAIYVFRVWGACVRGNLTPKPHRQGFRAFGVYGAEGYRG